MKTQTSQIAETVLSEFYGDYSESIAYCAKIAGNKGPLASQYKEAAMIIKSKALSGNHHSALV